MKFAGYCHVKKEVTKSRNLWGDVSEIAMAVLPVLEKSDRGDCLCYLDGKGIVDIDHEDVRLYIPNLQVDPLNNLIRMVDDLISGNVESAIKRMEVADLQFP